MRLQTRATVKVDTIALGFIVLAFALYMFLGLSSPQSMLTDGFIITITIAGLVLMQVNRQFSEDTSFRFFSNDLYWFIASIIAISFVNFLSGEIGNLLPAAVQFSGDVRVSIVLIGVMEETVFRGFFTPWLVNRLGLYAGLISQALLFMIYHAFVYGNNVTALIFVFGAGIVLGFAAIRTQRLSIPMAAHILVDYLSTI
jgi:membrane protease YdiL (CAAX protease family)